MSKFAESAGEATSWEEKSRHHRKCTAAAKIPPSSILSSCFEDLCCRHVRESIKERLNSRTEKVRRQWTTVIL